MKIAIRNIVGDDKTEVSDLGDGFEIGFLESKRYYEVDKNGNFRGYKIVTKDLYAGDIEKDLNGNKLDGSEEHPYEINCIEDLVAFSIMTYQGDSNLNLKSQNFQGKYVILTKTLDFKANSSYKDPTTMIYGDLNEDGVVDDIKTELTKQGEECGGFPGIGRKVFRGVFDGKRNYIKNLYQNGKTKSVSFFFNLSNGVEIKKLSITGKIIGKSHAAGFIALESQRHDMKISECNNYADITGCNMVGGIVGYLRQKTIIENCKNYGTLYITKGYWGYSSIGGIAAGTEGAGSEIKGCVNYGDVSSAQSDISVAGIVGTVSNAKIGNCINKANVKNGIVGTVSNGKSTILNCCNFGECSNGILGSFSGRDWNWVMDLIIKNCYNIAKCSNSGILGYQGPICKSSTLKMYNCYNAGETPNAIICKIEKPSNITIVTNISNTYYDTSKSASPGATAEGIIALNEDEIKNNEKFVDLLNSNIGEDSELRKWKIGDDGYPTFE